MNPASIIGGIAATFQFCFPNHSAANGCTLSARLVGNGETVTIAATNATGIGPNWTLVIPANQTSALPSGSYTLLVLGNTGTLETLVANHVLTIQAATETDLRSPARKTLDALIATLAGKATQDQASASYNGRSISRFTHEQLQIAIARQSRIVAQEENRAAGKGKIQSVAMRFK